MRARGLKPDRVGSVFDPDRVATMRARGLKHLKHTRFPDTGEVAPHAGARIVTYISLYTLPAK